jgi:hypothetical protein
MSQCALQPVEDFFGCILWRLARPRPWPPAQQTDAQPTEPTGRRFKHGYVIGQLLYDDKHRVCTYQLVLDGTSPSFSPFEYTKPL